ncbi:MAG TPA: VOC family protein [Terriglobia bacterium]|nr:VOC family protein [Terriglobia bacterium]
MVEPKFGKWILCAVFFGMIAVIGFALPKPADVAKPTVDLAIYRHIVQVGWVVKDLDPVVNYWQMLGLRDIHRSGNLDSMTVLYHGKKTSLKVKMAFADIGGVQIEWIQPVEGHGLYDEFLNKHGDGVQHLAYRMPTPAVMDQQIHYFSGRNVEVVQSGTWKAQNGEGRFAYLDTAPRGGNITVELMYNPDWPAEGETPTVNEEPMNKIVQYALVVPDVRKVGAFWQRIGFGGLDVVHNLSLNRVYRGQPGNFEMDLGWGRSGDVPFEWIQSTQGPNVYDDALKAHGEGFHHLAFDVKDMDEAIAHFKSKGVEVTQSGAWDTNGSKGRFAYLDTDAHGGVTIELLWNQPAN